MIDGRGKKRCNLTGNSPEVITFDPSLQHISILVMGNANVYYKLNSNDIQKDDTANLLTTVNPGVDIYKNYQIKKVALIADADVEIQWDSQSI